MATNPDYKIAILATDSEALVMGFSAFLLTIPPVHQTLIVDSIHSLMDSLETVQPALILIDSELLDGNIADPQRYERIDEIGRLAPESPRVLLAGDMEEYRELVCYTRDTVIIKGTDPAGLANILERLLQESAVA